MGFWSKERPVLEATVDKTLKNTGSEDRPFFAKVGSILRLRLLGLLIFKYTGTSTFPELKSK